MGFSGGGDWWPKVMFDQLQDGLIKQQQRKGKMKTVLESDLVAEQVFVTTGARIKILLREGNDLCTQQAGLTGISVCSIGDFAALVNQDGTMHVGGPEPASWKEAEDIYRELVWDLHDSVSFVYLGKNGNTRYDCNDKSRGDIIEDGYRLAGYYEEDDPAFECYPDPIVVQGDNWAKLKYARLVLDGTDDAD